MAERADCGASCVTWVKVRGHGGAVVPVALLPTSQMCSLCMTSLKTSQNIISGHKFFEIIVVRVDLFLDLCFGPFRLL